MEAGTNAHYMHFCREPTVVAAREKHLRLLSVAIHRYQQNHRTAICPLDTQGWHIDSGADEEGACVALLQWISDVKPELDGRNIRCKTGAGGGVTRPPPDGADRANPRLVSKKIDHGIYLLKEPIKKVRTFQAHVGGISPHGNRNVSGALSGDTPWRGDWHLAAQACSGRVRSGASANGEEKCARLKDGIHVTPLLENEGPGGTMASHFPRGAIFHRLITIF